MPPKLLANTQRSCLQPFAVFVTGPDFCLLAGLCMVRSSMKPFLWLEVRRLCIVQDEKQLYLLSHRDETTDALGSFPIPTKVCRQKFHRFFSA